MYIHSLIHTCVHFKEECCLHGYETPRSELLVQAHIIYKVLIRGSARTRHPPFLFVFLSPPKAPIIKGNYHTPKMCFPKELYYAIKIKNSKQDQEGFPQNGYRARYFRVRLK